MKTTIKIDCEDEMELLGHLSEIRKQIKRAVKKQGGEITKRTRLTDSNCYGDHVVNINPHK